MTSDSTPSARTVWLNRLLALTVLCSAWLLFQVQPMVAKRILPWFGGGASVWTIAMLFFQTALLVGYLYAHLVAVRLPPRRQVLLHAALLATAVVLLAVNRVVPSEFWKPLENDHPSWRILVVLAACVGLPYLMLAATAPLVQVWFGRANPGRSPYRLYALSNVGSLAALLSYPFLVEPNLGVARQGVAWSLLFALFAAMCATSGVLALGSAESSQEPTTTPEPNRDGPQALASEAEAASHASLATGDMRPRWLQYGLWLALPACASVALLAITNYLCQDVASIPLLWIVPLAVYLVSFILSFDSDWWYRRWVWLPLFAASAGAAVYSWRLGSQVDLEWQAAIHLSLLFSLCMACHGELAQMRPAPARLTTFYLCIAAGGALGGFLAGIVAPLALHGRYELQLSIVAAWVLALGVMVTDRRSAFYDGRGFVRLAGMGLLLLALVVAMYNQAVREMRNVLTRGRNFYGVLDIAEMMAGHPDAAYQLNNGRISHGAQFLAPENRRVPTQYYAAGSGISQLLGLPAEDGVRRVGVIGLGAGALAAYAENGDEYVFYEINPQVIALADEYFTFMEDARQRGANVDIVVGDARLSLEREPARQFDVLVIDAFSGDAIPAHLLTLEAIELYLQHLKDPSGVLAVHISNLHLDLARVVLAAAERFDLDAVHIDFAGDDSPASFRSEWVLMTRDRGFFAEHVLGQPLTEATAGRTPVQWTDDYSNLLQILKD